MPPETFDRQLDDDEIPELPLRAPTRGTPRRKVCWKRLPDDAPRYQFEHHTAPAEIAQRFGRRARAIGVLLQVAQDLCREVDDVPTAVEDALAEGRKLHALLAHAAQVWEAAADVPTAADLPGLIQPQRWGRG